MCLILHSKGHVGVKLVYEQIWPILAQRENGAAQMEIVECYDFILRSYTCDLDELYVLSPNRTPQSTGIMEFIPKSGLKDFHWIFAEDPDVNVTKPQTIQFSDIEFEATRVRVGAITLPDFIRNNAEASAAFTSTDMTMNVLKVFTGDNQPAPGLNLANTPNYPGIKQFDPKRPGETTYWLRLAFRPMVNHLVEEGVPFGQKIRLFPCDIKSHNLVLDDLKRNLEELQVAGVRVREGAKKLKSDALDNLFRSATSSTRIEDHRIAIVTGGDFLAMNFITDGAAKFWRAQNLRGNGAARKDSGGLKPDLVARIWLMGANHFPNSDPLLVARGVYRYLHEWAPNEEVGKSKEAVTTAVYPDSHANISHIVQALRELNWISHTEENRGMYYHALNENNPIRKIADCLLSAANDGKELLIDQWDAGVRKEWEKKVRDLFYGAVQIPVPKKGTGSDPTVSKEKSRFHPNGGRIHYDLVFAQQ